MTGGRMITLFALICPAMMSSGCVQRTISITSKPDGALVHLNDEEVGRTPLTVPFTFYGTYQVQLERDGYATLLTQRKAKPPWWDTPGADLFAEILPGRRAVKFDWHFDMKERQPVDEKELIKRAEQLKRKAREPG